MRPGVSVWENGHPQRFELSRINLKDSRPAPLVIFDYPKHPELASFRDVFVALRKDSLNVQAPPQEDQMITRRQSSFARRFVRRSGHARSYELFILVLATLFFLTLVIPDSTAQTYRVLYTFQGGRAGDGEMPLSGLIMDQEGSLYGTTQAGGPGRGVGTIFKLSPGGIETLLHVFDFGIPAEGEYPLSRLLRDPQGNLYGTTSWGGDVSCYPPYGCGTVYKLDPAGNLTILHAFTGADGWLLDLDTSLVRMLRAIYTGQRLKVAIMAILVIQSMAAE